MASGALSNSKPGASMNDSDRASDPTDAGAAKSSEAALEGAFSLVGTGAAVRAVSALALGGSMLATTAVLVRMLGPASYGALAFGLAAVGLASAFTSLGLGPAVTRTVAEYVAAGDRSGSASVARGLEAWVAAGGMVGIVGISALMAATQDQLTMDQRLTIGIGLGLLLLGKTAAAAAHAFALGSGRLVLMDIPALFANLLQLLTTLTLLVLGVRSLTAVAAAFGAVGILTVGFSLWATWRIIGRGVGRPRRYSASVVRLARLSAPYAISGVMIQVITYFDVLVLGLTQPSRVVGTYEPVVVGVGRITAFVSVLMLVAFLPAATSLITRNYMESFAELYGVVSKFRFVVSWPLVVVLAIAPVEVCSLLFGDGFQASPTVVRVLLVGYVVDLILGLNGQGLVASGERRKVALASLWPLASMVLLSCLLIPPLGALGAALATAGSVVVLNVAMSWALRSATGVGPLNRDLSLVVLTSPVVLGLALMVRSAIGASLLGSAIATASGWLVWVGILRLLSALRLRDVLKLLPPLHSLRG